jgi:filamentous hemagglutinin family protein
MRTRRHVSRTPVDQLRLKAISVAVASVIAGAAYGNPTGPSVAAGSASFSTSGNTLSITNAPGTIINWQQFSIRPDEITRFIQANAASAVLNRVTGQESSQLLGQLLSNGRVFLVNPNGVTVGAGAVIDTAGFVASSLGISNADFLAGRMRFTEVAGGGKVVNQGTINASSGGSVYLIAPNVENHGVITAPNGDILLAAGKTVEVVSTASPHIRVEITAPGESEAVNVGQLVSGRIGIYGGLVRNGGTLNATSAMVGENGNIILKASGDVRLEGGAVKAAAIDGGNVRIEANRVVQTAGIDASGASGGTVSIEAGSVLQSARVDAKGSSGTGGAIEVKSSGSLVQTASAVLDASGTTAGGSVTVQGTGEQRVFSSAAMAASATSGAGGEIKVLGNDIVLAGAKLDASGDSGGGKIMVGGDFHGANPAVPNAQTVKVNASTVIAADAKTSGSGGQVAVWSDDTTKFSGTITARGGSQSGDGGTVEISGKQSVQVGGKVDASAPNGAPGSLLIDPKNIFIEATAPSGNPVLELDDPNPGANENFGASYVVMGPGYVVVTDPNDVGNNGAAYIFDAVPGSANQGALLSSIVGSSGTDRIGSSGIEILSSGNVVVRSNSWSNNGTLPAAGALTFGNLNTGAPSFAAGGGVVGAANSLVGGNANDSLGFATIQQLGVNNKLAVVNPVWNGNRGAVTFGDTFAGLPAGAVSAANSYVGTNPSDFVGNNGVFALFGPQAAVINSANWNGNTGAVTHLSLAGPVSTLGDGTITPIPGTFGTVSAANSLVGAQPNQYIGSGGIVPLSNGNYVVLSPIYSGAGGTETGAGAVTWVNGATGLTGVVSVANSIRGNVGDQVGSGGITELTGAAQGNFVIASPSWGGTAGASTWVDGSNGLMSGASIPGGFVSQTNSLTGTSPGDLAGATVHPFSNGNYLLVSPSFQNNGGAATYVAGVAGGGGQPIVNGSTQPIAPISGANSLLGGAPLAFDLYSVQELFDTSVGAYTAYALFTPAWANGAATNAGAVTIAPLAGPLAGPVGPISAATSLVGTNTFDRVGQTGLDSVGPGRFLLRSYAWNSGAGAVTPIDISSVAVGLARGAVDQTNSLVGQTPGDGIGSRTPLSIGGDRYVLLAPNWTNTTASATNAGAVTPIDASTSSFVANTRGFVNQTNSLVGDHTDDRVGEIGLGGLNGLQQLSGGDFVIASPSWNGGAGAMTFFNDANAASRLVGTVSSANSIVGANAGDQVGTVSCDGSCIGLVDMGSGRYLMSSPGWGPDATTRNVGAVTLVNSAGPTGNAVGTTGVLDVLTVTATSLYGSTPFDSVGADGSFGGNSVYDLGGGRFGIASPQWSNGALGQVGAVTFGDVAAWTPGAVSGANSIIGAQAGDQIGSRGLVQLSSGLVAIVSPEWANGAAAAAGAVTFVNPAAVPVGPSVGAANSLVGTLAGDRVGSYGIGAITSANRNYVQSPDWNGGFGAVTFFDPVNPTTGAVLATNSIVGQSSTDFVGASGVSDLGLGKALVYAPQWNGGRGAAAFVDVATANPAGAIGALALTGAAAGDQVGNAGLYTLPNGNVLLQSPSFAGGGGALTFVNRSALPAPGVVSSANSLIGSGPTGSLWSGYGFDIRTLPNGDYIVVNTAYNSGGGMIVYGSQATGAKGTPSPSNGWIGAPGDGLGTQIGFLPGVTNQFVFNAPNATKSSFTGAGRLFIANPSGLGGVPFTGDLLYTDYAGSDVTISAANIASILDTGTRVLLQASNDIKVNAPINAAATTTANGSLTMSAGRSIVVNANIDNQNQDANALSIQLTANDPAAIGPRDPGLAQIVMASGTSITGAGNVLLRVLDGTAPNTAGGIVLANVSSGSGSVDVLNASAGTPAFDANRTVDLLAGTSSSSAVSFNIAADGNVRFGTPGGAGATVVGGLGTVDITSLGTLTGGGGTLIDVTTGIGPINLNATSIGAAGQPFGMQYGSQGINATTTTGGMYLAQTAGNADTAFIQFNAPTGQQVSYGVLAGNLDVSAVWMPNNNPLRLYTNGGDITFPNNLNPVNAALLQLDAGSGQIVVPTGVTFNTPVQTTSFMQLQGGTTNFNGAATLAGVGITGIGTVLNLAGGPMTTTSLTWGQAFTAESNTITGNAGSTLTVNGSTGATISGDGTRSLNNVGLVLGPAAASLYVTAVAGGGAIDLLGTASLTNNGNLTISNDNPIAAPATSLNTFTNNGFITKLGGTGTTTIGGPVGQINFVNNGTVNVQNGRIAFANNTTNAGSMIVAAGTGVDFNAGTHSMTAAATVAGPGQVTINGAATAVTASGSWTAGSTTANSGTFTLAAGGSLGGQLDVLGGTANVNGTANATSVNVAAGQLNVGGTLTTQGYSQTGGTVAGTGDVNIASSYARSGGTFGTTFANLAINQSTGNLDATGLDAVTSIKLAAPGGTLNVATPIAVSGLADLAGGNVTIGADVSGATINIASPNPVSMVGTVTLTGATNAPTAGLDVLTAANATFNGTLTAAGLKVNDGATANLNGASTVQNLAMGASGSTLNLGAPLTVNGSFTWNGATGGSTSTISGGSLALDGTTAIAGDGTHTLDGTVVDNYGSMIFGPTFGVGGPLEIQNGAALNNRASFDLRNDQPIISNAGTGTLTNFGTLGKSGAGGTTVIGGGAGTLVFDNQGSIQVNSGTLALADGSTLGGTVSLGPAAGLAINSGTQTLSGNVTGGSLILNGGTLDVNGTLNATNLIINAGALNVNNGANVGNYQQTGGAFGGGGSVGIASSFAKTGGTFGTAFSTLSITQAAGNLDAGGLGAQSSLSLNAPGGILNVPSPLSVAGAADLFGGQGINVSANVTAGGTVKMGTFGTANITNATVKSTGGAINVTALGLNVTAGTAPAGLQAAAGLSALIVGDMLIQGGTAPGAFAEVSGGNGPINMIVGKDLHILGGSGANAYARLIGNPDVGTKAAPLQVGGEITMQEGSGSGAFARIESVSANSINVYFPNAATGGYTVNGQQVEQVNESGFFAGGDRAILAQNLIVTYGLPNQISTDVTGPTVSALDRSTEPPGGYGEEEEERRRQLQALFDDIEDAPVCR